MATTATRDREPSPSVVRTCAACGKGNRIPAARLAERGRCGACKADLAPQQEPVDADEAMFDAVIAGARVPVLIDFWAAWCGPCRMVAPEVARLAREMAGRALVLKVDTDAQTRLAARHQVTGIPLFAVYRGGRLVRQQAGAMPLARLRAMLETG